MPERQSTPGGTTAEQDAEAPARGSAADAASSRPGNPDEPTRPVSRGDAATVGLPRGAVSTPAVDHPAARTPGGAAANGTSSRPAPTPAGERQATGLTGSPPATPTPAAGPAAGSNEAAGSTDSAEARAANSRPVAAPSHPAPVSAMPPPASGRPGSASAQSASAQSASAQSASAPGSAAPTTDRPVPASGQHASAAALFASAADRAALAPTSAPPAAAPAPSAAATASPDSAPGQTASAPGHPAPGAGPSAAAPGSPAGQAGTPTDNSAPATQDNAPGDADDTANDVTRPAESPIVVVRTHVPDAEKTQVLRVPEAPTVQIAAHPEAPTLAQPIGTAAAQADAPTVAQPTPPPPHDADPGSAATPTNPRRRRKLLLVGGGVLAALALLYGGDLAFSAGSVPRGVTVAGVPVGGLALADAERTLRAQIEPRTTRPVPVTVGDATSTVDPVAAGLSVDWTATIAQAEHQPLNPITRIESFFATREVGVVTKADPAALDAALAELKPAVDKPAVEGNVRFDGLTPQRVEPVAGQQLDVAAAAAVLTRDWVSGAPVALPLIRMAPTTTSEDVTAALEKVAKPAVSAPIAVTGEKGTRATLAPQDIAAGLTFRPNPAGGLAPELNLEAIAKVLRPQLAASETPGRDATLDFTGGAPVVVPSQDGRGVDYPATLKALVPVLTAPAPRQVAAIYGEQPAKLTTEGLGKLGITGILSEFTTRGFAADSGMNIRRAAEQINGTIVQPGGTFSLNAATNPRDAAHGYVEAGIIEDGHPARGVGGGVSQVATTLYNASYFAGMTNVEHKEHSFYISRYPAGREATVFDDLIDLKFRNDNPTAVMIQTVWTPSSITVRIYGTKRYDVTSTTGPRTNPTEPKTVTIPEDEKCAPSKGAPGFTVTDTRTLKEISTGQVRTETRTVRYNPSPIIECGDD